VTPGCCAPTTVRVELVGGPADGQVLTMVTGTAGLPARIDIPVAPPQDARILAPGDAVLMPNLERGQVSYDRPAAVSDHDHTWRYTIPRSRP
jgi:hypothetical protein